jgi:hypothetical protein
LLGLQDTPRGRPRELDSVADRIYPGIVTGKRLGTYGAISQICVSSSMDAPTQNTGPLLSLRGKKNRLYSDPDSGRKNAIHFL